ncbi:hypothetical protein HPP92_020601 [Vanilla planifolia]|uniref:Uncharacterized protein n=1 Tax=Vanilla planifolia TaxID=51239 RepID=A0A835PXC2_VANPL|nr:hypothetical protein HPP92_020601 [Vanilla planifolia]
MPVAVGMAFWGGLLIAGLWFGLLSAQVTCRTWLTVIAERIGEPGAARSEPVAASSLELIGGEQRVGRLWPNGFQ